ncbi:MAG: PAS domain S-box protein [Candidatus Eisenbacteria bacterium]|nr:PAS domain S-box protein [Candidatus Eisenbacteria bacterium]
MEPAPFRPVPRTGLSADVNHAPPFRRALLSRQPETAVTRKPSGPNGNSEKPSRGRDDPERLRAELSMAEAACADAERRYTALFEGSRDGIIVTDRDGDLIEANRAARELFGYSAREMLRLNTSDLLDEPDAADAIFGGLDSDGFIDDLELWARRKDGTLIRCLVSASCRMSDSGKLIGYQGIVHDITGRRATEEALRKSEEMYRSLFEESQDVIYITSREGDLIDISPSASGLFGYPKDELLDMDVKGLYAYPEDRRRFQEEIERSGAVRSFPVRLRNRSGSVRYCLLTSTVRRGSSGETIGYHGIMRDITDQRRAERARERERSALRVMAEAAVRSEDPDALCAKVLDGLLGTYRFDAGSVLVPEAGSGSLGRVATVRQSPEEAEERDSQESDVVQSIAQFVTRTGVQVYAPDVKENAPARSLELPRGGSVVASPLVGPTGELLGVLVLRSRDPIDLGPEDETVFQTIGEMFAAVLGRAHALQDKAEMRAQLLQAQKLEAIGTLASGVAHDFNNILTAIQGFADLALMSVDSEDPLGEDLEKIRASAERGAKLVRQLLMFSRRQPVEFGPLDLNNAAQALSRMLAPLIGENISMNVVLERDVWRATGDESGLQQVLMNLSVNARDAMPDGGILTIRTENVTLTEEQCGSMPGARQGAFVRLSVSDTGSGMDQETVARIFEPFFSTKTPAKGTGLGLAVVYGIVQQHEGWIDVVSEPGEGTTFSVYIPVSREPDESRARAPESEGRHNGEGERVLVVEDERTVRDLAVRALSQNGYEVLEAENVRDALEIVGREEDGLSLVFSDVVLPDQSGVQLARTLAEIRPHLPVLLSSGHADERAQYEAIRDGGLPFLPKPYTLPELLKAVREHVRQS